MVALPQRILVRGYKGANPDEAAKFFAYDASQLMAQGYFPITQTWAQGQYGCGAFLVAVLLFIFLIGLLVFIYMLIVKPEGTLTVTYEWRGVDPGKTCPRCGASVPTHAVACSYCGYAPGYSQLPYDT